MALTAANWRTRFEDAERERHELADIIDALRGGRVDAILASQGTQVLRLLDAELIEENQRLVEELQAKHQVLQKQKETLEIAHIAQQRSEETTRALLDSQSDSAMLVDPDGKVLAINQVAVRLLKTTKTDIVGHSLYSILPKHLREDRKKQIKKTLMARQSMRFEERDEDEVFDVHMFPVLNSLEEISQIGIFVRDVTEDRNIEQQLVELANIDPLTGLANRTFFIDHQKAVIVQAARTNQKIATLHLDLDGFKEVNDTWGHDTGDQLLRSVADRIRGTIRQSDVVARLGGDEFAVLLGDLKHPDQAAVVAQKILDSLAAPHQLDVHEVSAGASIGIACFPEVGSSYEEINQAADAAMYHAKRQGRNNYRFYDPRLQQQNLDKISLVRGLRQSLQNREMSVVYQPKVRASNKKIAGVEALARWHHDEKGAVPPNVFIPLAEEIGLISDIGEWVLRTACQDAKQMQKQLAYTNCPDFSVAVNVSPRQLKDLDFTETVRKVLDECELPAHFLQIELTESSIMEHPETSIEILGAIRELGVSIAIDDFGTGYSSLSYLSRLPLDTLKIDLSFVQAIGQNAESESIVKSIFALAQILGLETVAEGVETEAQIDFLCQQGCDYLQGYYFSKPIGKEQLAEMIATGIAEGVL